MPPQGRKAFDAVTGQRYMRALTLWQPWASLVACGAKRIETRRWTTGYRGPLAIHAAARPVDFNLIGKEFVRVAAPLIWRGISQDLSRTLLMHLPVGKILAVCHLVDVLPAERADVDGYGAPHERMFGDYAPGRFAWFLDRVEAVDPPVPWRGHQRLWHLPDDWRQR